MSFATPPALRVTEHLFVAYRHAWRGSIGFTVVAPVLFLAAIGVGLGSIVDTAPGRVEYLHWVAPGLLATASMQTAAGASTFPIMSGMKWLRTYHGMVATPLSPSDVVAGQLLYVGAQLLWSATAFSSVAAAFGVPGGWRFVLAVPAATLCGLAFAAPIAAWAATRRFDGSFPPLFRFVIAPLFLFSGAFVPVDLLPAALTVVATVTPAWHGVSLCRDLLLGVGSLAADVGHALVLAVYALAGWAMARRTFTQRLAL